MATPLPPPLEALERRLGVPPGGLDGEDKARAEEALSDAATLILAEAPANVAARWLDDAPDIVTLVALKAARREYDNPQGIAQEALGEHSVSLTTASGVYLTSAERQLVRRAATGRAGFVGSIPTPSAYGK